jgi:hypothetical protein
VEGVSSCAFCGQVLLEMGLNVGVMQNAFTFGVLVVVLGLELWPPAFII